MHDPDPVLGDEVHRDLVPPVPDYPHNSPRPTITVPVAVTLSATRMAGFVRSIAERAASDIRHYSSPGRGGHFLAFEEPALIAGELGAFMRSVVDDGAAATRPAPGSTSHRVTANAEHSPSARA